MLNTHTTLTAIIILFYGKPETYILCLKITTKNLKRNA